MSKSLKRILAFDPNTKGFGYVVFEGVSNLIDWGVKDVKGDKNENSIEKIRKLLEFYKPDVLVVEDCHTAKNRRRPRIKQLIALSLKHAEYCKIHTCHISNTAIKTHFKKHSVKNKHQIAQVIAKHYEVLNRILPPKRKIWMSEDSRMSVFKSISMVWIYYVQNEPI